MRRALRRGKWKGRLALSRLRGAQPIFKDPNAFFSTPWLHARLGMTPVVMIRHPAAFVSSLKLKDWRFDYANLTAQPRLTAGLLASWREEIERAAAEPPEFVDHAILLWRVIYGVAMIWREAHPDWIFLRHEDLSRDPQGGFRELYAQLGFAYGPEQAAYAEEVSGAGQPGRANPRRVPPRRGRQHRQLAPPPPPEEIARAGGPGSPMTAFYPES